MMFHVIVFIFSDFPTFFTVQSQSQVSLGRPQRPQVSHFYIVSQIYFCLILPCQHEFKPDYFAFHCFLFLIFPFSLWLKVEAGSLWADLKKNYHKKLTKKTSNVASPGVRRLLLLWNLVIVLVAKMCTG